jgi:V8-like Glu-specific endopeptidase
MCDTKVGNSGSPLVQHVDGPVEDWHIRGVHFAAMKDGEYNLAIPIDDQMLSWMECYKQNRTDCAASTWLAPVWL